MKRFLGSIFALGLTLVLVGTTQAGFFGSTLVSGADNLYEDQDREALVDVDGDGNLSVGDVLVGFARIDDHTAPAGAFGPLGNRVYAIFSQQVADINATGATFEVIFEATTAANAPGLTLSAITGSPVPTAGIFALFSSATPLLDLINVSPGDVNSNGVTNLFDYFDEITTNASLDFVAGVGSGGGAVATTPGDTPITLADFAVSKDHFIARTTPTGSLLISSPGALADLPTLALGVTIANFEGGLSILLNNDAPVVTYNTVVAATETGGGLAGIFHDISITGGTVRGTAGAVNAGEWDNVNPDTGLLNPGGFTTDADFVVNATVIPEPTSMTLLGLGTVCVGALGFYRRRKRANAV